MTRSALDAAILRFCTHLFEELGVPEVKTEVIRMMPLKFHIGITIPDVAPEIVLAACSIAEMHAAVQKAWPPSSGGFVVNFPPGSIGIAADDLHVIFDIVFYSVSLEIEEHLKLKP